MGAGDDVFLWDPGDGNDTIEGQDGADSMLFNGANIAENFDVSANGQRVRFTRNIANIVMDLNDVEDIDVTALGGVDNVVVNDLSGTALRRSTPTCAPARHRRRRRGGRHGHRQRHQRRRRRRGAQGARRRPPRSTARRW